MSSVPAWVPFFNVVARPLIGIGLPPGPDVLLTVRGRRTGQPRSTPVTLCRHRGRRGLISPADGDEICHLTRSDQ
jgi:hypothetical protein